MVRSNVAESLKMLASEPLEFLPENIRTENGLCGLDYALRNIHVPESMEAMKTARQRLAFDELLNLQLGMRMLRHRNSDAVTGCTMSEDITVDEFKDGLPIEE